MAKFIEVETEEGLVELINTQIIEFVHIHEGKTILRLSLNNCIGTYTIHVKNSYDNIKYQISQ